MTARQRTIERAVKISGVGLHSGRPATLALIPAPEDSGIVFVQNVDGRRSEIKVDGSRVVETMLSTTLGIDGSNVHTVEHLLSAVWSLGVDNLFVELDSVEVPILDGSAFPFAELIREAGIREQNGARRVIRILSPIVLAEPGRRLAIYPADEFSVDFTIRFDHPALRYQRFQYVASPEGFISEIARARTFCFLREVEAMRAKGLAQGGSLDNAVVIGEHGVLNPEGLRYSDEFVRHKILDLIGDLSLLGYPILGRVEAECAGHRLNVEMVNCIRAQRDRWQLEESGVRVGTAVLPTEAQSVSP